MIYLFFGLLRSFKHNYHLLEAIYLYVPCCTEKLFGQNGGFENQKLEWFQASIFTIFSWRLLRPFVGIPILTPLGGGGTNSEKLKEDKKKFKRFIYKV